MDDNDEHRLESIDLKQSINSEVTLLWLGSILYDGLMRAERLDELEMIMDAIGEFTVMASYYGEKTGRVPESLGVDLNEAAALRHYSLSKHIENEWYIYANQFKDSLYRLASEMGVKLPALE
jgi:hypothetical protein